MQFLKKTTMHTGVFMLLAALFCSCNFGKSDGEKRKEYQHAINIVLAADAEAKQASAGNQTLYAQKMREIPTVECPSDFAPVWIDHVHAWEHSGKIQEAQKELKKGEGEAATLGAIATMLGSSATPFKDHLEAEREADRQAVIANEEIHSTWMVVERTAASYGATLPKSN